MAEKIEAQIELPANIKLEESDLRTGIALAHATAQAQARLQAIADMENLFIAEMLRKYGGEKKYKILDWVTGLEEVTDGD